MYLKDYNDFELTKIAEYEQFETMEQIEARLKEEKKPKPTKLLLSLLKRI
jgi:hypothetical protein